MTILIYIICIFNLKFSCQSVLHLNSSNGLFSTPITKFTTEFTSGYFAIFGYVYIYIKHKIINSVDIKIGCSGFDEVDEDCFVWSWLAKVLPGRKLSKCLKRWQSVGEKSGKYGG